ncbi:MAG: SDR family oxidoreductase [Solirubrobacterales bacterium]|nr:SDR family oxidoreductase [Solirubrobacterales bacterium]
MTDPLTDAVAVVTGAGKGIGRQIALAFARAGASLALVGRDQAGLAETRELVAELGGPALVVPADIRAHEEVVAMASEVLTRLGRVDVLVCNSGIAGPTAPLWEISLGDWEETLRVNLTGTFLCCRALLPAMIERRSGAVIVIGSISGKRPLYGRTPYTASKLGLVGLVRTLAWETGPHGIRVNLISPGFVAGPRIERVIEGQAQALGVTPVQAREGLLSASPMARLTEPEDVAACAVFLASPGAASITGEDLNVSAGVVMY